MAQLTLLDLSSNEEIIVPPEGFVFGRVGGDADIQLEDNTIAKRQARVSNRAGNWVLEVMVVPTGQRLPRPQALQQGSQFSVGNTDFEVLAIEEDEVQQTVASPGRGAASKPPPPAAKKAPAPPPSNQRTIPAQPAQKRPAPAPQRQAAPPPQEEEEDLPPEDGGDEPAKGGVGALFVGVPKGIAYYMLNVPKLLVNPLGTIRKGIEELPTPPLAKTALIGYALPALFISALLPAIGTGIGLLIGPGHIFSIGAFLPIGPAIGSIIGALVAGFFFHPVMAWIITKLQGESDERSRSNYFLQLMTATLLLSVPNALAAILASIRWVNLLAPFITTAASLVMTYLMYQWLVFFKVHKIIPKVVAVLGLLSAVFTILGLVSGIQRNLAWGSVSDASAAVEAATEVNAEAEAANPEAAEQIKKAQKAAAEQIAKAQKLAEATEKAQKNAEAATEKAEKATEKAEKAANEKAEKAEKHAKKEEPVAEPEEKQPAEEAHDAPAPGPSGAYTSYAHRREAVEKRLEADPTVLAADSDLQKLYGEYLSDVAEIEHNYDKDRSKHPERTRLYDHLRDAELYKKTAGKLEKISGKLGVK